MREWDIPFDELNMGELIGKGRFGTVFRGNWHGDVAIKVLNMNYMDDDKTFEVFKQEVTRFEWLDQLSSCRKFQIIEIELHCRSFCHFSVSLLSDFTVL